METCGHILVRSVVHMFFEVEQICLPAWFKIPWTSVNHWSYRAYPVCRIRWFQMISADLDDFSLMTATISSSPQGARVSAAGNSYSTQLWFTDANIFAFCTKWNLDVAVALFHSFSLFRSSWSQGKPSFIYRETNLGNWQHSDQGNVGI